MSNVPEDDAKVNGAEATWPGNARPVPPAEDPPKVFRVADAPDDTTLFSDIFTAQGDPGSDVDVGYVDADGFPPVEDGDCPRAIDGQVVYPNGHDPTAERKDDGPPTLRQRVRQALRPYIGPFLLAAAIIIPIFVIGMDWHLSAEKFKAQQELFTEFREACHSGATQGELAEIVGRRKDIGFSFWTWRCGGRLAKQRVLDLGAF